MKVKLGKISQIIQIKVKTLMKNKIKTWGLFNRVKMMRTVEMMYFKLVLRERGNINVEGHVRALCCSLSADCSLCSVRRASLIRGCESG